MVPMMLKYIWIKIIIRETSLVAQTVKHLPTMRETRVQSLGQEYLLEKEMAAHSSILAWKIPWTEEPGWLQSMGSQRVRHDWVSSLHFLCNIDDEPYICLVSISSRLCTFDNRDCSSPLNPQIFSRCLGHTWPAINICSVMYTKTLTSVMPNMNLFLLSQLLSPQQSAPVWGFLSAQPSAQNFRLNGGMFWGQIIVFVSFYFSHYLM